MREGKNAGGTHDYFADLHWTFDHKDAFVEAFKDDASVTSPLLEHAYRRRANQFGLRKIAAGRFI